VAKQGIPIVVSAPSGAGKQTLLRRVLESDPGVTTTVSATTRPPREGEVEGREYYFFDRARFEKNVEEDAFLEFAEVHGNLYGTLRSDLDRRLATGKDVLLELDVQGMRSLRKHYREMIGVFIMPPSREELERRLRARGTDSEAVIQVRLRNAGAEMDARGEYDYIVVNDNIEEATCDMLGIIRAARCRTERQLQED
jgi:guanylate kinase